MKQSILKEQIPVIHFQTSVTNTPLVSVSVVTYNHVEYIKKCIDSILMQKTKFSFEILLGEDESTDGTREICLKYATKYPEKIRLFLHDRKNVIFIDGKPTGRFNFIYNLEKANGKYIALCDGDDYWTDPYKLQEQVEFLEANKEYGLVHTDYHRYYTITGKWLYNRLHKAYKDNMDVLSGNVLENLLYEKAVIWTGTVCFRKKYIEMEGYQDILKQKFYSGDYPLWCWISKHCKVKYIDKSTAVRQVLKQSATHGLKNETLLKVYDSDLRIVKYFVNIFKMNKVIIQNYKKIYYTRYMSITYKNKMKALFCKKYSEYINEGYKVEYEVKLMKYALQYKYYYWFIKIILYLMREIKSIKMK